MFVEELLSVRAPMGSLTFVPSPELKILLENLSAAESQILKLAISLYVTKCISVVDLALRTNDPAESVAAISNMSTIFAGIFARRVNLEKGC